MSQIQRIAVVVLLAGVIGLGAAGIVLERKQQGFNAGQNNNGQAAHPPITYGSLAGFFTGQETIIYPRIFDNIYISTDAKMPTVNFGTQMYEGFQVSMTAAKMTKRAMADIKAELIGHGWRVEKSVTTPNNLTGEVISSDPKAHPDPSTTACDFSYNIFVPISDRDHVLSVTIGVSQLDWLMDNGTSQCTLLDDQNYNYFKAMIDHVMARIEPSYDPGVESIWPAEIPAEIPPLNFGELNKWENLSGGPIVSYQPEKLLFVLELSKTSERDIQQYFTGLKKAGWKISSARSPMTDYLSWRAEKGDYVVVADENTKGGDSMYFNIMLSVEETNKLIVN